MQFGQNLKRDPWFFGPSCQRIGFRTSQKPEPEVENPGKEREPKSGKPHICILIPMNALPELKMCLRG